MKKILYLVYNRVDACSFYRAGGIIPDLNKKLGGQAEIYIMQWNEVEIHWQFIIKFELVIMQRPFTQEALNVAEFVKGFKIPIWVDHDDFLLGIPDSNKFSQLYNPSVRENIKNIIRLADIVTVTTEELRVQLLEYNENIVVIPNAFNDFIFKARPILPPPRKIIAWRGTDTHQEDLQGRKMPINRLMTGNKDWIFHYIGYNPWFLAQTSNAFAHPEMDIIIYHQTLQKINPAIMQVPLTDHVFNRCKSNIAFIEAAYAGAVCVAPEWEEWKKPGVVTYKASDESYEKAFKPIMKGDLNLVQENNLSWNYVKSNLLLSKVNEKRIEIIKNL